MQSSLKCWKQLLTITIVKDARTMVCYIDSNKCKENGSLYDIGKLIEKKVTVASIIIYIKCNHALPRGKVKPNM